jgi:hypothetical protein
MRRLGLALVGAGLLVVIACGDDLLPSFDVLGDAGLLPDGFQVPDALVIDAFIADAPASLPDGQPGPDGSMCTSDPRCPDLGSFCFDSDLIGCTLDAMGCRQVTSLIVCTSPRTCEGSVVVGAVGTAGCVCPAPGAIAGTGCPALGAIGDCTGDPTYLECADQNGCLVWADRTCPVGVCNAGNVCTPPPQDAGTDAPVMSLDAGIMTKTKK